MHKSLKTLALAGLALSLFINGVPAQAQEGLKTVKLTDQITAIFGAGGTAATFEYDKGLILIDDKLKIAEAPLLAALKKISSKPVTFLLNTHWHFDHAGNNVKLGEMNAVILSHHNVRKRLSVSNFMKAFNARVPALQPAGLPIITFTEETRFHLGGEEISIFHLPHAHTDGDAAVYFKKANIIHAADVFFNTLYPFIDFDHGGSIDGVIAASDRILGMANAQTRIIPGHGPMANAQALKKYRDMLSAIRNKVAKMIKAGKSVEQVVAAKPSADFDKDWANKFNMGFTKPKVFVARVYEDLKKNMK